MSEIVMPRLSDTMEEGTILRWLKRDGEQLARGEELVEIETDKATMIYESDQDGVLEILAAEGDTLAVGALIARVGEAGAQSASALVVETASQSTAGIIEEGPASGGPAGVRAVAETPAAGGSHAGAAASAAAPPAAGTRVKASPLARRIASESGIDLQGVSGSGPGGRIVKADLQARSAETAAAETAAAPAETAGAPADADAPVPVGASAEAVAGVLTAKGETTVVELSRTQQTIARRMAESKATIPDFTLRMDVDMDECVTLRTELKRLSQGQDDASQPGAGDQELGAPTPTAMVVTACALALREHPRPNGSYRDGRLQLHARVNVGVAVAAEDALVVPTVFDADEKSLGEIARETRALAGRVRAGTITPPELGGGTFTVSNLGMYGVHSFAAIINPPQAAILSVGAVELRAVAREGELIARHSLTLTLVCDHRILYGAEAAQFLARIRELLQTPSALTL